MSGIVPVVTNGGLSPIGGAQSYASNVAYGYIPDARVTFSCDFKYLDTAGNCTARWSAAQTNAFQSSFISLFEAMGGTAYNCTDPAQIGATFTSFMNGPVIQLGLARIACSVANTLGNAVMPLQNDAIIIVRKGANSGDPCSTLVTNVNSLALSIYSIMPLVEVQSLGGVHQYNIWAQSNPNATEQLLTVSGVLLGYVSLTANTWATVAVNDLSLTPPQFYAAP